MNIITYDAGYTWFAYDDDALTGATDGQDVVGTGGTALAALEALQERTGEPQTPHEVQAWVDAYRTVLDPLEGGV